MAIVVGRDGIVPIPADDLRAGDMVLIQTGDVVPADLKLLDAVDLELDEFELTGEIMPQEKHLTPGADLLAFQGTVVVRGHGKGIVLAAGENTEYGKILRQSISRRKGERIPAIRKGHVELLLFLIIALPVSIRLYPGYAPASVLLCVLLASSLLLLPKDGMLRLIARRCRQKKLLMQDIVLQDEGILEAVGDLDVFCFDKTGVLTTREMEVKGIWLGGRDFFEGEFSAVGAREILMTGSALCHDLAYAQTHALANPLDHALMSFAERHGFSMTGLERSHRRIWQKPFSSQQRYMACGFQYGDSGKRIYFAKGDPDVILRQCRGYLTPTGETRPLDFELLSAIRARLDGRRQKGGVIIAMAFAEGPFEGPPPGYTFLSLFEFENRIKPDAKAVLQGLGGMGIRSVLLTGDRAETALRVGVEAGIDAPDGFCLTGGSIGRMPLSEVARQAEYVSVFARVSPSQKGIVVRSLQQRGHRVAMVGDGANDVIALRSADVGISFFNKSSPLAKRTAMVLVNDLGDILRIVETARGARRAILSGLDTACLKSHAQGDARQ
jgi:Ca2+-transporting ATPase